MQSHLRMPFVVALFALVATAQEDSVLSDRSLKRENSDLPSNERAESIPHVDEKLSISNHRLEDDIQLTKEQAYFLDHFRDTNRAKRQAFVNMDFPKTIWTGGIVPYRMDSSLGAHAKVVIKKGISFLEKNVCVKFEENGTGNHTIIFKKGAICSSSIGRVFNKKEQDITIGPLCESWSDVTHEVIHALGFYHMHQRTDRYNYIDFIFANMESGHYDVIKILTSDNSENYGPYEYGSVMHYHEKSFAKNKKIPTIVPVDRLHRETMGSATGPSFYDIMMINRHYGCADRCKKSRTICSNGGIPDVMDCSKCKCPSGYGGAKCEERPGTCGRTLKATNVVQKFASETIGNGKNETVDDITECVYWITADRGRKISVTIQDLCCSVSDGCEAGGVEFKTSVDQRATGYRFCDETRENTTLVSATNLMPIILYNRFFLSEFEILYKMV